MIKHFKNLLPIKVQNLTLLEPNRIVSNFLCCGAENMVDVQTIVMIIMGMAG